jgi:oligopeptide transport system ATP-binding protein
MLVSHDLSVISQHCDVVNVMYAGRIVERGTSAEIFAKPRHPYTDGLLKAIPKFEQRSTGSQLESIAGSPPDLSQLPAGCPFAPRCPRAVSDCGSVFPEQSGTSETHRFWCHNPL